MADRRGPLLAACAVVLLSRAAAAEGEATDVVVAGTRTARTPGSVHVVKKEQLERFEHDDAHAILAQVPGVYARGEDGVGLRPNIGIRGAASDRSKKVTLMEDGVLFAPAPYSAPAAYYFPIMTRMTQVRVIKGPAAIVYGPQTVGGAIDLVTAGVPEARQGTLDLAAGQYGYRKLHGTFGAGGERVGFLIEGVHLGSSGFKDLDGGGGTGFYRNEWMVKGRWVPDPSDRAENELGLKLGYSDEASNETYVGLTDDDLRKTPNRRYAGTELDRMQWNRTHVSLTHRFRPLPELEVTTTAYRQDLHRVWRKVNGFRGTSLEDVLASPSGARNSVFYGVLTGAVDASDSAQAMLIGPNDRTFVSQGLQTVARWSPRTGPVTHRIEYGLRWHYDEVARKHSQQGYLMTAGRLVLEPGSEQVTALNSASTHALALHVVDAATLGPVTVSPGLRVESIRSRLVDAPTASATSAYSAVVLPGAGAYWNVWADLGVLAGAHKGFSPAPPGDRAAKTEESINYEAGARWAGRRVRVEAIGFFNDYSNVTSLCTESNGCQLQNVDRQLDGGKAHIYGLEAFAEIEPRIGGGFTLPARVTYTLTQTEFLTSFTSLDPIFGRVSAGDELPYVPRHQGSAQVGIESTRWGAHLAATYVGSMRERAGSGEPAPGDKTGAALLLDASAMYRVTRWLQIYANARNLTNQAYIASRRPFGARPNSPLWVQVGLKVEF